MPNYLVNKNAQSTGEHEVHQTTCERRPEFANQQHLGSYQNCHQAVHAAKNYYSNVDGCFFCCNPCHTR